MQKTKLGITVGALGAITFFAGFFGGYLAAMFWLVMHCCLRKMLGLSEA